MFQKQARSTKIALSKSQVALEMGVALVGAFLLLWGSVRLFVWMNNLLASRQKEYESTRVEADREGSPLLVNIEQNHKLNFSGDAE